METNNKEWLNNATDSKKKSSKAVTFISLAILILGLAGTGIYFFALDKGEEADNPPSLSFEGGQGFIFSGKYLKFEDKDIADAEDKTFGTTVPSGIQVLYSNTNTNLQNVVDAIRPDKSLSIMFAYYNEDTRKFDVFPKGPYGETNLIDGDKLEQYEIPANRGFFLIASKTFAVSSDIKLYTSMPAYLSNTTGARTYLKNLMNSYPSMRLDDEGDILYDWRLMIGSPEQMYDACGNRLKSVFMTVPPIKDGVVFEQVPVTDAHGYAVWVKFQGDSGSCVSEEPGDDDDVNDSKTCSPGTLSENDSVFCLNSGLTYTCNDSRDEYIVPTQDNKFMICSENKWSTYECEDGDLKYNDRFLCIDSTPTFCNSNNSSSSAIVGQNTYLCNGYRWLLRNAQSNDGDDSQQNTSCTENLLSNGKMCIGGELVPCTTATQNVLNTNEKYICDNNSWKSCSPSFLINSDKTYSCLSAGGTWSMVVAEDCEDTDQREVTISSNSAVKRKPLQNELNKFSNLNKNTEYSALTVKLTGIELVGGVSLIQYQNSSSVRLASTDSGTTRTQANSVASYLNPITSELIALFPNTLADGNYSISIPFANLSFINVSETTKEVCGFTSNVSKVISISHTNTLPASATKCFDITDSQVTVSSDKKLITVVSKISKPANIPYTYYINTTTPPYSYMTLNNASPEFNSKNYDTKKSDLTFVKNKITSKFDVSGFNLKESDNEFKLRYLGNMFIIKDAQGNPVVQSKLFDYCNPALNVEYIKTVASSTVDETDVVVGGETGEKDPCKDVVFSLDNPTPEILNNEMIIKIPLLSDFLLENSSSPASSKLIINSTNLSAKSTTFSNNKIIIKFDISSLKVNGINGNATLVLPNEFLKSRSCNTWFSPEYPLNLGVVNIPKVTSVANTCTNGSVSSDGKQACDQNSWVECNVENAYEKIGDYTCSQFFVDNLKDNPITAKWIWVYKDYRNTTSPYGSEFFGEYFLTAKLYPNNDTDYTDNLVFVERTDLGVNYSGYMFYCGPGFYGLIDPSGRYSCGFNGSKYKVLNIEDDSKQSDYAAYGFLEYVDRDSRETNCLNGGSVLNNCKNNISSNEIHWIKCGLKNVGEQVNYKVGTDYQRYLCTFVGRNYQWRDTDAQNYAEFGLLPAYTNKGELNSKECNIDGNPIVSECSNANDTYICSGNTGEQMRLGDYTYLCHAGKWEYVKTNEDSKIVGKYLFPDKNSNYFTNNYSWTQFSYWNLCNTNSLGRILPIDAVAGYKGKLYKCENSGWVPQP